MARQHVTGKMAESVGAGEVPWDSLLSPACEMAAPPSASWVSFTKWVKKLMGRALGQVSAARCLSPESLTISDQGHFQFSLSDKLS